MKLILNLNANWKWAQNLALECTLTSNSVAGGLHDVLLLLHTDSQVCLSAKILVWMLLACSPGQGKGMHRARCLHGGRGGRR